MYSALCRRLSAERELNLVHDFLQNRRARGNNGGANPGADDDHDFDWLPENAEVSAVRSISSEHAGTDEDSTDDDKHRTLPLYLSSVCSSNWRD